jgi:hypothetical protein
MLAEADALDDEGHRVVAQYERALPFPMPRGELRVLDALHGFTLLSD